MKIKNKKSFRRSMVFSLLTVSALILSSGTARCQDQSSLDFKDCKNFEDTCLVIGEMFIENLYEKKFENLADLFSDEFLFRALIPSSLVTSNKPLEAALEYKKWFYVEDPGRYEILDLKTTLELMKLSRDSTCSITNGPESGLIEFGKILVSIKILMLDIELSF